MPIPSYQEFMLPVLKFLADKKEHSNREMSEALASILGLTEEDRRATLQCGEPIYVSRTYWAKAYLKKAGLIEAPKRGTNVITERGLEVLSRNPSAIDNKLLSQFPEFVKFLNGKKDDNTQANVQDIQERITPEELLEDSYKKIREALAQELLDKIMAQTPDFFERLVVELIVRMGYGGSIKDAGKAIGKSGDEGIDGIIKEDKLGLDVIYIQAKRWKPDVSIGRPEIQKFVGALAGQGAKKGIFITTAAFSKDAREYQPKNETKVVLIDGERLVQLMIDYNIGVATQNTYELKRIDNDYFEGD